MDKKDREISFIDISDLQSLSQKWQVYRVVLNENIYKAIFKLLIDILPEFLQANSLGNQTFGYQNIKFKFEYWFS